MKNYIKYFMANHYWIPAALFVALIVGAIHTTDADETVMRNWIVAFFSICLLILFIMSYRAYKNYEKPKK